MVEENTVQINDKLQIPLSELQFRFATSSGPGGQHVNKAETKAILQFDITKSPSLDEEMRSYLLQKLAKRLDKEGVLQIQVQESRSQHRNREIALRRFQQLLADALKPEKKRRKTKPSRAALQKRLDNKRKQSKLKQERRKKWDGEQ